MFTRVRATRKGPCYPIPIVSDTTITTTVDKILGVPSNGRKPPTLESYYDPVSVLWVHPRSVDDSFRRYRIHQTGDLSPRHLRLSTPHTQNRWASRVSSPTTQIETPRTFTGGKVREGPSRRVDRDPTLTTLVSDTVKSTRTCYGDVS